MAVGSRQRRASSRKEVQRNESLYEEIHGEFGFSEIEVVVANFPLQSGGKIPEPVCRKADTWLRAAARVSPRAVLALSFPNDGEITRQNKFRSRK